MKGSQQEKDHRSMGLAKGKNNATPRISYLAMWLKWLKKNSSIISSTMHMLMWF